MDKQPLAQRRRQMATAQQYANRRASASAAADPATTSMSAFWGWKSFGTAFHRKSCGSRPRKPAEADPRRGHQTESPADAGIGDARIDRLEAVTKRLDPKTVEALLAKLQAPPLDEISDLKTLQHVVFGLEELAGPNQPHAA